MMQELGTEQKRRIAKFTAERDSLTKQTAEQEALQREGMSAA